MDNSELSITITARNDARRALRQTQRQVNSLSGNIKKFGRDASRVGRSMTRNFTLPIVGAAALAVKSFSDFEEAMVEVQKVTDQTTADQLGESIKNMSERIPLARTELAGLAADAARFGVEGTDNIESFTEAAAKMSVATDLSATEAGESFARLAQLTGTPIPKIENLGSAINELSNNAATSSSEIVDSMLRSSAALSSLGLTNTEMVALSGTLNEVSESAERAGTRLRRTAQELMDPGKVEDLAAAMDLTVEQFTKMRDKSPVDLLRTMAEEFANNTDTATKLRGELSTTSRQAIGGLAQNLDGLNSSLKMTKNSFGENTSLTKEFEAAQGTLKNELRLTMNTLANAGDVVAKELKPALESVRNTVTDLAKKFQNLPKGVQETILKVGGFLAIAGPAIFIIGKLAGAIGGLVGLFTSLGGAAAAAGGAAGIGAMLGPVGWAALAIAALGGIAFGAWKLIDAFKNVSSETKKVGENVKVMTLAQNNLNRSQQRLEQATKDLKNRKQELKQAEKNLTNAYKQQQRVEEELTQAQNRHGVESDQVKKKQQQLSKATATLEDRMRSEARSEIRAMAAKQKHENATIGLIDAQRNLYFWQNRVEGKSRTLQKLFQKGGGLHQAVNQISFGPMRRLNGAFRRLQGNVDSGRIKINNLQGALNNTLQQTGQVQRQLNVIEGQRQGLSGSRLQGGGGGLNLQGSANRAHGGPVKRGEPYIVGENQPELFIPQQSGHIQPSVGGQTVQITQNIEQKHITDPEAWARKIAFELER